eukprot:TRINITY_DN3551_c0_g1_i6.p1 TRINITY_DN3551_c0_g1~~TRINITY_DN3551_c0_g1_i6.p1  ORF type:complete len:185 (-),score=28.62 TRINITY_DN3551_c0_g1_i6:369-923(-)
MCLGMWSFNRIVEREAADVLDVALYLEKIASSVARTQIEKSVQAPHPTGTSSVKPINRPPASRTSNYRNSPADSTPSNTSSSSTPSGSTPGSYSSSTPSDYTPPSSSTPSKDYTSSSSPYIASTPPNSTPTSGITYTTYDEYEAPNYHDNRRTNSGQQALTRKRSAESLYINSSSQQQQKRYKR